MLEIIASDRELVIAEAEALREELHDPEARERYARLADAVAGGTLPDPLLSSLEWLLEIGLRSGRVRRVHGPHAEAAFRRLFQQTPRGAAANALTREVNRALESLRGQRLSDLRFTPRGPGTFALEIETDRCRLGLEFGEEGVAVKDLSFGV